MAALLCTGSASATLLVYEGFNYSSSVTASTPDGDSDGHPDLNGLNGGDGFTSAWAETIQPHIPPIPQPDYDYVQSGSLAFGSLTTSGNSLHSIQPNQGHTALTRSFNTIAATDGTTIWASVLMRSNNNPHGDMSSNFTISFFSTLDQQGGATAIEFGSFNSTLFYGMFGLFGPQDSTVSSDNTNTALLVLRIDFLPGDDKFQLYINPTPGQPPPTVADVTVDDLDLTNMSSVLLNSDGQKSRTWDADELRIGTTYADVVPAPEPTGAALLSLGTLLLAGRRRR